MATGLVKRVRIDDQGRVISEEPEREFDDTPEWEDRFLRRFEDADDR